MMIITLNSVIFINITIMVTKKFFETEINLPTIEYFYRRESEQ